MDNLTELLKNIDRSKIDEALALLQSMRNDQHTQNGQAASPPPASTSPSPDAQPTDTTETHPTEKKSIESEQVDKASSGGIESTPAADDTPFASPAHVVSPDEKKSVRNPHKTEKEVEREARKKLKEEETQLFKLEADTRKAMHDEERKVRRTLHDSERETRKAAREAEKEARRKMREEELEAERELRQKQREAELEAKQKAREAEKEALKAPREAPNNLAIFGFLSNAVKVDNKKNRLFSNFVQDKRIVPTALQLWAKPEDKAKTNGEGVSVVNVPASEAHRYGRQDPENSRSRFVDEEWSLLHPPMCLEPDLSRRAEVCVRDFNAMIEASNTRGARPRELLRECACSFHVAVAKPYPSFDNEVVFSGFFAIGYDPCQSRPPYFGTYNHLQEGNLNEVELLQMARFPLGREIPRLSNIEYDYDSGDDWDVMEGDEDIAASSSEDSEVNTNLNSLDSSDLEFINDDDEDSDCDIQRRVMEARQRRLFRLRNKDKLVPSYSGPFVGIPNDEHPLRNFDEMERVAPLTAEYFNSLLETELNALASGGVGVPAAGEEDLSTEEREAKLQRALMEAALKNRREMTEHELKALHDLIKVNAKISTKMVIKALKEQQLCVGVAQAEIARTIKRFYERRRSSLVLRETPWSPTDERLFATTSTEKKSKSANKGDKSSAAEKDVNKDADGEGDNDGAEKEKHAEKAGATNLSASTTFSPSPAEPQQREENVSKPKEVTVISVEVNEESALKVKQVTLTELLPQVGSPKAAKRQREDVQLEDENDVVSASTGD